jgi:hypothetical protein
VKENTDILEDIIPLFGCPDRFIEIGALLAAHSNLPGPRGNLTLAYAFADRFANETVSRELLELLARWVHITPDEAPANSPREYLPFCGILAFGAHYHYTGDGTKALIMEQFKTAMNDKRWRMREGAAMGFQRIAEKDFNTVKRYFTMWYPESTFLEKRAFIAALAHPPILGDPEVVRFSLVMSEDILHDIMLISGENRRAEDFKALSKGLQYALSVFAAALPDEGFAWLRRYAQTDDPEIRKIVKANLGKARLAKKYPRMVEDISMLME